MEEVVIVPIIPDEVRVILENDLHLVEGQDFSSGINIDGNACAKCIYCNKCFRKQDLHTLKTHFECKRHKAKMASKADPFVQVTAMELGADIFFNSDNTLWGCQLCNDDLAKRQFGSGGGQVKKHYSYIHKKEFRKREKQEEEQESYLNKRIREEAEKRICDHKYIDHLIETGFFEDQINEVVTEKLLLKK